MSKLVFNYSSMNAGKTTRLLQVAHSYLSSGKKVACLIPDLETRFGEKKGTIKSRIGVEKEAIILNPNESIRKRLNHLDNLDLILVDESQFLTKDQIIELSDIVDYLDISVICFGLRNDYMGNLFEGTKALFELADVFCEIQGVCSETGCCKRATHVLKTDINGNVIKNGVQKEVGSENMYSSVCRKHWKDKT